MTTNDNSSLIKLVKDLARLTTTKMNQILISKGKGNSNIIKKTGLTVKVEDATISIKTNLPDYAKFVDEGRKPGKQPPLKNIEAWCKSKNIPTSAAFPIARNIGKKGIKPTKFLNPLKDFVSLLKEKSGEALRKDIIKMIQELKKEQKNK